MDEYPFMKRLKSEHQTTRHLAFMMATVGVMMRWCTDFYMDTEGMPEDERFNKFCDAIKTGQSDMNLEGVEWRKLYEFCKDPFGQHV